MDALSHLRQEIDALDRELIQLFAKRLELVSQVGEVKHEKGLPIYAPDRELAMLQARRKKRRKQESLHNSSKMCCVVSCENLTPMKINLVLKL